MILLDTDHCIYFLRGRQSMVAAFASQAAEQPAISAITAGELYFGAMESSRPDHNLAQCEALLDRLTIISVDRAIVLRFARIKTELYEAGRPLEDPDLLIAATALHLAATLVTHNTSHYARVTGLTLDDWMAEGGPDGS